MGHILNIEHRTRNFEQQKYLKGVNNVFYFDILSAAGGFCGSAVLILEGPDSSLVPPLDQNGHPGEAPGWGYSEKDQIFTQPAVGAEPLTAQLFFQHIPVQILKA
jgi:hypothetical protein